MDLSILIRGLALGFSIAAPVGPIGVLCIRRTLAYGRLIGFCSGLGAASADAIYAAIAAFGLTVVSNLLISAQTPLRIVGGLFLLYLGIKTFFAPPATQAANAENRQGVVGAFTSTLALTLTNPATIFSFVAIFAGLNVAGTEGGLGASALIVVGVFVGSVLWWFTLSGITSLLRERFNARAMQIVNWLSGTIISVFGLAVLLSLTR